MLQQIEKAKYYQKMHTPGAGQGGPQPPATPSLRAIKRGLSEVSLILGRNTTAINPQPPNGNAEEGQQGPHH